MTEITVLSCAGHHSSPDIRPCVDRLSQVFPPSDRPDNGGKPRAWARIGPVDRFSHRCRQKPGWVYFAYCPELNLIKVGFTMREDVEQRLRDIRRSLSIELILLASFRGTFAKELELHDCLGASRFRSEWYQPTPEIWVAVEDARLSSRTPRTGAAA